MRKDLCYFRSTPSRRRPRQLDQCGCPVSSSEHPLAAERPPSERHPLRLSSPSFSLVLGRPLLGRGVHYRLSEHGGSIARMTKPSWGYACDTSPTVATRFPLDSAARSLFAVPTRHERGRQRSRYLRPASRRPLTWSRMIQSQLVTCSNLRDSVAVCWRGYRQEQLARPQMVRCVPDLFGGLRTQGQLSFLQHSTVLVRRRSSREYGLCRRVSLRE